MRDLARRLFTLCCVTSLLLFLIACALWASSRHAGGTVSVGACTLRWTDGRVQLIGPLGDTTSLTVLPNESVRWYVHRRRGRIRPSWSSSVSFVAGGVGVPDRQLLRGLESPDTFVAAHLALLARHARPAAPPEEDVLTHAWLARRLQGTDVVLRDVPPDVTEADVGGLRLTLTRGAIVAREDIGPGGSPRDIYAATASGIDPAQRAALRAKWHARFGVGIASARFGPLAMFAAVLPAFVGGSRLVAIFRARSRTRRGMCGLCGYDLRASHGRCPECGATPTPASRSWAS